MILYILLTCYNSEKTIERAIRSVLPQLSNNIRCLIINDGSKDSSKNIIEKTINWNKYIEYIEQENWWISRALNYWITYLLSKIEEKDCYVARLDSDDELLPEWAIKIYNFIKDKNYPVYIGWLVDSEWNQLTKFYSKPWFIKPWNNFWKADYMDCTSYIVNLKYYKNEKYSYLNAPQRAWDWLPNLRISRDFWYYITNIYFYKVYFTKNSLSRPIITPKYAQTALETSLVFLNEFSIPAQDKNEIFRHNSIISRYYAVLWKYKEAYFYFKQSLKYFNFSIDKILLITVNIFCFIPKWYKLINILAKNFYK